MTFDIVDRPQETPVEEVKWTEQALDDLRKAYHQGRRAIRVPYGTKAYPVVHHQLLIAFGESPLTSHFRLRTKAQRDAYYAWLEPRKEEL